MPIYEYACGKCGHRFEEMRLSSAAFKGIKCPECGSKKVAKQFSTFSASVSAGSDAAGCADGSCAIPNSPCSSGMCGLN